MPADPHNSQKWRRIELQAVRERVGWETATNVRWIARDSGSNRVLKAAVNRFTKTGQPNGLSIGSTLHCEEGSATCCPTSID